MSKYGYSGEWLTKDGEKVLLCEGATVATMKQTVADYQAAADAPAVPIGLMPGMAAAPTPVDKALSAVRATAGEKILSRYPSYKQMNMGASAIEMMAAGLASGPAWEGIQAAWAWIKSVRAEANRLEAAIVVAADAEAVGAVLAGAAWPA